jgi:class 3 adenylate cyclase
MQFLADNWGTAIGIEMFAPSRANDERFREWWARLLRLGASPQAAVANLEVAWDIDVRGILSTISVPTLVLHRSGDLMVPVESGRYLASKIPGARYVELPGDDHLPFVGDTDALVAEIEEFLTGTRSTPVTDRILATVLFTDIVGSTERAAELGDRRWRELLDAHDAVVARNVERFRGRVVKTTGDGALATFDGPARAISCAREIRDGVRALGIEVRVGLHTGEVEVRGEDLGGIAVHIGARVAAQAAPGDVLVSSSVPPLVAGSGIEFEDRGEHSLKGVPGDWRLFAVGR